MKYIVNFLRVIVGVFFIFSGFVKAIDPVGFSYKLEEYFSPQIFNIGFLHDMALPQATFLSIFEILLGVLLLLGIFRKFTVWALLLMILFFSFLTFYSAYFNKVTDCGCFGDFMKLEPWTSFWKDIILLVLILVILLGIKHIKPFTRNRSLNITALAVAVLICGWISYMGIKKQPIIDFRAYAVGKNIPEGMKSAEELGKEPPQFRVTYTMKNKETGEITKITDQEYLEDDKWYREGTPWELQVDLTETKKISSGYEPPIHDFILDCEEGDMTDVYMEEPKLVFFVMPFADKVSTESVNQLNQLYNELITKDVKVIGLSNGDVAGTDFQICFVDQITLKTMLRTNPGIMTLKTGTVVGKFHNNPLPTTEEILETMN
ncbi:MAG: BT_3928 family protein [Weeksellaceae bacterium]